MFKVYRGQIAPALIDSILNEHERFKRSTCSFFRAQGATRFERPILNQHGNQLNSIHNPHLLGFNLSFSSLIENAIVSENISRCLSDFTGSDKHVWYQSMFFDNSTGTKLHQDCWYLDTIPNGKLVGVWIALENITHSAGPFCIYSNTDTERFDPNDFDLENLEHDIKFKDRYPSARRYEFTAQKGDILLWDSFSLHGALMPTDSTRTRKSITAHFYPQGSKIQDAPVKRLFSIYDHDTPKATANASIFKATTIHPLVYQSICSALYFIEKLKPLKYLVMRERDDVQLSLIRRIERE